MIYRGEELIAWVKDKLTLHQGELGLQYIVTGDGQLLPTYPAAVIDYEGTTREDHTTHYFLITIECSIYLLHGNLGLDRSARTIADLELATRVTSLLHQDRTLGGQVVSSIVSKEEQGTIATKNDTIIGTQLTFTAENREPFR